MNELRNVRVVNWSGFAMSCFEYEFDSLAAARLKTRRSDQHILIPYMVSNPMARIELTFLLAQTVGYEATNRVNKKVNLKIKDSGHRPKIQALFSLSNGTTVSGGFDGGKLSTLGGLPFLKMVELESGLVRAAADCISDNRQKNNITYTIYQLLWQRVLLICAGFAAGNDSNLLRNDPAVKLAMGLDPDDSQHLASQPTISRLENSIDFKDSYRLALCMIMFYISRKKDTPKEIILDFDGSCVEAYGDQQGSSSRDYFDANMYFPLFVYDQDGWLICAILRPGKEWEARLTVPVLKRLVKYLRKAWPKVQIIVRADSAFGSPELYDWCEDQEDEVFYIVPMRTPPEGSGVSGACCFRAMKNEAAKRFGRNFGPQQYAHKNAHTKNYVMKKIKDLPAAERRKALKEQRKRFVRVFANGTYKVGHGGKDPDQWRQERRVVAVCTQDDWKRTCRYFVTNLPVTARFDPQYLINELYSARGEMELRIKEFKALEGDKLSCRDFAANQARLTFHALAYMMMFQLRESLPRRRRGWTFATIQKHLLRLATRVTQKGRNVTLHWPSDFEWKSEVWTSVGKLRFKTNTC